MLNPTETSTRHEKCLLEASRYFAGLMYRQAEEEAQIGNAADARKSRYIAETIADLCLALDRRIGND